MGNNTFERVPLYLPYHHFINLISADLEQKLLDETEFDFFYAKLSFKEGYALEEINDEIENLVYIALLFKKFYDVEGKDLHDAPSYMKDLVKYTFIDLEQFEDKYSQANIGEMYHFVRRFLAKAPVNSKVKDMKTEHPLLMGLKVTFYVNSLLYFAITMNEKRFPFGSTYYEYVSFLTHQFYIILKGLLSEKDRAKHIRLFGTICNLYDYTTLIYLFEHNPELAPEIVYLLSNSNSNTLRKEERNLIVEYLENKIFVNKEDKASLFQILQPKT